MSDRLGVDRADRAPYATAMRWVTFTNINIGIRNTPTEPLCHTLLI